MMLARRRQRHAVESVTGHTRHAYIRVAQRDLSLASVRYRGLIPGCALQDLGWRVTVDTGHQPPPPDSDLVVAVKPLSSKDSAWVREVARTGTPVLVDLCDNIFIDGYASQGSAIGDRFMQMSAQVAGITVPTSVLRNVVAQSTPVQRDRIWVVPDIVETPSLLRRQQSLVGMAEPWWRRLARAVSVRRYSKAPALLWFGNHGASYANFGMDDLLLFSDALAAASRLHDAELWVVSNNRGRFETLAPRLPIRTIYFEWTPVVVDHLLARASVCLVPNSLDAFSAAKSANRAVKALNVGVPVVATPTAAYAGLEKAVWLSDPVAGLKAYLEDPELRESHLKHARDALRDHYSFEQLKGVMENVTDRVLRSRGSR